ncbi:NAD kinase [Vulcanimicrobium alpinum]|uniref:NAD kinase n=1 Tax=Vulcanimicrobium alpinum TaxID=3016050 RepID=A0AAN1XXA5_UNVUL|nr:NAD(+)/NADH kinase [Vulcanimicrobium alpinum]BDE07054.1 NAD kinase [Vulcanimicrobium alpinum]
MKAIALYVNTIRARAAETARHVARIAADHDVRIALVDGAGVELDVDVARCDLREAQLFVTVGGDGTLLRAARIAHPLGIPILGVNTGRLGFLTEVEANDEGFAALARVFAGIALRVEERVALYAQVAGHGERHFALNEVVVRRVEQARLAPYGLSLDGEMVAHIPSDGVIVATPTGSTAYFLSAGGPIIHPRVEAIGVAALMPHTLFARPLLVPTDATIEITCDGELTRANLETDGMVASPLQAGDRVTIRRADTPVRFARVRSGAFFARLEEKLQWGVPIKSL